LDGSELLPVLAYIPVLYVVADPDVSLKISLAASDHPPIDPEVADTVPLKEPLVALMFPCIDAPLAVNRPALLTLNPEPMVICPPDNDAPVTEDPEMDPPVIVDPLIAPADMEEPVILAAVIVPVNVPLVALIAPLIDAPEAVNTPELVTLKLLPIVI
jgi:hypothetical protein